jgi:hypothetical protein
MPGRLITLPANQLLALDGFVDAAHKQQARAPAYTAQHEEEGEAHDGIVAKEEARLHQPVHLTPAAAPAAAAGKAAAAAAAAAAAPASNSAEREK